MMLPLVLENKCYATHTMRLYRKLSKSLLVVCIAFDAAKLTETWRLH